MPTFVEQPAVLAKLLAIRQLSSDIYKQTIVDGLPESARPLGAAPPRRTTLLWDSRPPRCPEQLAFDELSGRRGG